MRSPRSKGRVARISAVTAVLLVLGLTVGCSSSASSQPGTAKSSASAIKIWFSNPCYTCTTRWQDFDTPDFKAAVRNLDPSATVLVSNANDSTTQQVSQGEAAITNGANVLVINTIESESMNSVIQQANQQNIPVIAYDGMTENAKVQFYVSFDAEAVGELQAEYLVQHLKHGSTIVLINGAQVCSSCIAFKQGAHKVLDPLFKNGDYKLGYQADTANWLPANAQLETEEALTRLHDNVQGILAANDALAGGVIAALKEQGLLGRVLVTGQDATVAGLQDIVRGWQSMSIFKNFAWEATAAAKAAVALAQGRTAAAAGATTTVGNGVEQVPSVVLQPQTVDKANMLQILIPAHYVTQAQICAGFPAGQCLP
jgi:D-xylose transport system substrate-binding protein